MITIKDRIKFHIDEAKAYQEELYTRGNVPAVYDHRIFINWHKQQAKLLLQEAKQQCKARN